MSSGVVCGVVWYWYGIPLLINFGSLFDYLESAIPVHPEHCLFRRGASVKTWKVGLSRGLVTSRGRADGGLSHTKSVLRVARYRLLRF